MIIVTGCDNTGKTSLAKHLSEKYNIPIAPRFKPLPPVTESDWTSWFYWVKKNLESKEESLFDRFFIDELVYGPIIRGGFSCTLEQMAILSTMLVLKQPLYIYTCTNIDTLIGSFGKRNQYIKTKDVAKVLAKFQDINSTWPVVSLRNKVKYNYTNDPNYSRIDLIVGNYLREGSI